MTYEPHTQNLKLSNGPDFGVSPEDHSLLTLKSEYAHTAGKRALSAKLLGSAKSFELPLDTKANLDHFGKLTNMMLALDKSIREDSKYLEEQTAKDAVLRAKGPNEKDAEQTRLRVLSELCELTAQITPEDYDLDKLEAHLRKNEARREALERNE